MLFIFVVIIAFESARKQRTFRTRECETKVKKRATFDSSLFRHTSSSTTDRLRTCSSSQTPVKTNKKKERRVSVKQTNIGHHRLHEAEEEAPLERLSLFLSLSLSVGKKYTLQEGSFWLILCSVHHSVQQKELCVLRCIIIVSIISFHQKGERERERSEISLSRAQRARAAQARLGEIQNKKTSLFSCCSYSYLKLTHSIIRWNQSRRTAHKPFSFNNHRQSKSTPPFHSFYSQAL